MDAQTVYSSSVKESIIQSLDPSKSKQVVNKRIIVKYITPEQEVEKIQAYDTYRGNDMEAEKQRRTANGKYPTHIILDNGDVAHISYSTMLDTNLVALKITTKKKEDCYIFDKQVINSINDISLSSRDELDIYSKLSNSYFVWNIKEGKWQDLNKSEIISWEGLTGEEAKKKMKLANIIQN